MQAIEAQRRISPRAGAVPRVQRATPDLVLDHFYAANRPVILTGLLGDLGAGASPEALRKAIGPKVVDLEGDGRAMPFDKALRGAARADAAAAVRVESGRSARNARVLAPVLKALRPLAPFLSPEGPEAGAVQIAAAKTVGSLRHALRNQLTVQLGGRRRFKLLAPSEAANLYEGEGVLSQIEDLDSPTLSLARFPRLAEARIYEVTLGAGEALFLPLGWWRQWTALELSVSASFVNFAWPNGAPAAFPESASTPA